MVANWFFLSLAQLLLSMSFGLPFGPTKGKKDNDVIRVWLRYNKADTECFKAINKLSEDASSSVHVLRQMERSKSVLVTVASQDVEQFRKSMPCIRSIVHDPPRYRIVGPVHSINRRDLLIWDGQARGYGFDLVQADKLKNRGLTGKGITVCIIDSGFDSTHQDFNHSKFTGVSLISDSNWTADENGHGTLSAGIIAAQDNDLGLIGVAPGVNVIVAKIFDATGTTSSVSDLITAAEACRDGGANIINMSLGGNEQLPEEEEFFADLFKNDRILSIAASGNSGFDDFSYPASYPSVISVGAVNRLSEIATLSTWNEFVDIAAPGVNVWSTLPNNFDCFLCFQLAARTYASYDGTSASTPFVSGIAALLWSVDPKMDVEYVNNALLASALDAGDRGRDPFFGQGIVQGDAAFKTLMATLNGTEPLQNWTIYDTSNPEPPLRCESDDYAVAFTLVSDNYPEEVFWSVTRLSDNFPVMGGSESGSKCLPKTCYMVKVLDAAGDGLCCEYGQGYFELKVDEQIVLKGSNFTNSSEAKFGGSCVALDFDSKVPCVDFAVNLETDLFEDENSVLLEDLETGMVWWDDVELENGSNLLTQCVNPASCTKFTVFDSFGDGMDGLVGANLMLIYDKEEIFNGLPDFTFEYSWFVGDGCVSNSTVPK